MRIWLREVRLPFLAASVVPVLVGSAAGFTASGTFDVGRFVLAVMGMVLLHAGANVANDYFDHLSGNDPANRNVTPFSGGSRVIQEGLLSPRSVLTGALCLLAAGTVCGIVLAVLMRSLLILALGIVGLFFGYFYTATPLRLGYRGIGELIVGLCFGVLPVSGAFAVQTARLEPWVLAPGALVAILIFLVLLANEFPDERADRAVGKRTLVVLLGQRRAAWVYRGALLGGYVAAVGAAAFLYQMRYAGLLFLATLPLATAALRHVGADLVPASGRHRVNLLTMLLHVAGGLALAAGLLLSAFVG